MHRFRMYPHKLAYASAECRRGGRVGYKRKGTCDCREKPQKKHDVAGRASLVQGGDALELDKLELGRFDLITCNPPYLSDDEWEEADKSLKYEPKIALSSGLTHFCFIKN